MGTSSKALRATLDGWQISGISQFASSAELQANNGSGNFGLRGYLPDGTSINERVINGTPDIPMQPVLTCDPRSGLSGERQYINPGCFALPSPGNNGSFKMPYLKGPGFMNHDLSVFKNWEFTEHRKLQFRFSAYNFLNHPVWSFTNGDQNLNLVFDKDGKFDNPSFGIADKKFGRRIVQLALKFYF